MVKPIFGTLLTIDNQRVVDKTMKLGHSFEFWT